jgi:sulfate adenylyltransferase subunit 2
VKNQGNGRQVSVEELNRRRRLAAKLRDGGMTVAETARCVGLSRPTVIAAYKAFLAGGGSDTDVRPRGRPATSGALLSGEAAHEVRMALLSTVPIDHGLPAYLWDARLVRQWLAVRCGSPVSMRTILRLLAEWGFSAESQVEVMRPAELEHAVSWCREHYRAALGVARRKGALVRWAEDRCVSVPKKAPIVQGKSKPSARMFPSRQFTVLYLTTQRRDLQWMAVPEDVSVEAVRELFSRAMLDVKRPLYVMTPDWWPYTDRTLVAWVKAREPRIQMVAAVPRWFARKWMGDSLAELSR